MSVTECENCKRLEEMYVKDTDELLAEISRLRRENEKLRGNEDKSARQPKFQPRRIR